MTRITANGIFVNPAFIRVFIRVHSRLIPANFRLECIPLMNRLQLISAALLAFVALGWRLC